MKNVKYLFLLFTATLLLNSCADMNAKEIGRLPANRFSESNPKSKTISMSKGDKIAVWSDMDIEYEGDLDLTYVVEMYLGEELYETLEFDPLKTEMTMNEVRTKSGLRSTWSYSGKNKEITIKKSGAFKCIAYLKSANDEFWVNKAEVVLKKKG